MKSYYYVGKVPYEYKGYAEVYNDFTYRVIRNLAGYLVIKSSGYFPVGLYNEMPPIQIADKIRKILKMHALFCDTILKANIIKEESDYFFSNMDSLIRLYSPDFSIYASIARLHKLTCKEQSYILKKSYVSKETYDRIDQATEEVLNELDSIWKEIKVLDDGIST